MPLLTRLDDVDFQLRDLPALPPFAQVELADPAEFDVRYAINPHMRDADGTLQRVDRARAVAQWRALRRELESARMRVRVEPAPVGQPDFVFCANPGLPIPAQASGGLARFVPSRMASAKRAGEVARWSEVFARRNWSVEPLEGDVQRFEGTGDGLWHPRRRLLWGGVGSRTQRSAWEELAERYDLQVVLLELQDPELYHLDTCLALLDERTCLWSPSAFDANGRALIEHLIEDPIAVTEEEARTHFACNAFAPDAGNERRRVLIQRGSPRLLGVLAARGFECVELDTGEFMKSGGSVFCMKLAHCGNEWGAAEVRHICSKPLRLQQGTVTTRIRRDSEDLQRSFRRKGAEQM